MRRIALGAGALAAGMTLGLAPAVPFARAACAPRRHAAAQRHVDGATRAPLIVGDSVLLGAVAQVAAEGYEVDTRACRQIDEGLGIVAARRRAGTLPHLVVLALGTNGSLGTYDVRKAMRIVGPGRVLGLVTPREPDHDTAAHAIRVVAKQFPDRIRLLDWVRYSDAHHSWFAPDGIHLGPGGAVGLARLLRGALAFAVAPPCP
ncbi:MAG TPA: hypothetical protein VHZ31_04135 [Solirubrobacteraceae bacterium]|jgi:hypothetical protein|nr:hypothetical protein [Solirubrobacteraceae bacterium]